MKAMNLMKDWLHAFHALHGSLLDLAARPPHHRPSRARAWTMKAMKFMKDPLHGFHALHGSLLDLSRADHQRNF